MCDGKCGVGLPAQIGRPRKKIGEANGYASGKITDNAHDFMKNTLYDVTARGLGVTTGYVIASVIQENVEAMRDNTIVAVIPQMAVGILGKKLLITDKDANGFVDNVFSGMICKAGVNMFKALAQGAASKWGIKGIGSFKDFRPQMQYKKA
jgi:hypothetical protein